MKDAFDLAGFFAAHAVWCVSDGGPLVVAGCGDPDYEAWVAAFFSGVDKHEKGSKVWNAHIDQSR